MNNQYFPTHGDRTKEGYWIDPRPTPSWVEMIDSAHEIDCVVLGCYRHEGDTHEFTFHSGDDVWVCDKHWAEFYTYEAPRFVNYGTLPSGRGVEVY